MVSPLIMSRSEVVSAMPVSYTHLGALALTGVGVTFPIILLVSAFAAFAGMGGAPLASIQLGAGNREGCLLYTSISIGQALGTKMSSAPFSIRTRALSGNSLS